MVTYETRSTTRTQVIYELDFSTALSPEWQPLYII